MHLRGFLLGLGFTGLLLVLLGLELRDLLLRRLKLRLRRRDLRVLEWIIGCVLPFRRRVPVGGSGRRLRTAVVWESVGCGVM